VDGGVTASKVNINSASAVELEALPGIGEVIAQEILDYRTANGPFASVDDLLDVSGIGEVTLENIRDLVTV
jgi:competence protein ComEA